MQITRYVTAHGVDIFHEWFSRLKDKQAKASIRRRLDRFVAGNPGVVRFVRSGVSELKVDIGPGYRVYFAKDGEMVILLLCGGDKGTQVSDIGKAVGYWKDYQQRKRT